MKFKGTTALFVVLVGLAGWVYFTDIRGREQREQEAEESTLALPVDDEAIAEIRIEYPDRTIIGGRSEDGVWTFVTPEGFEADQGEWDLLASNIPRIERDETLTTEAGELERYGLENPALRVTVGMTDGATHQVLFGAQNPRKIYNYAKLASSDDVFFTPSSWLRIFSKEADELRDKTVLRFEQENIDSIVVEGAARLAFQKTEGEWTIEAPLVAAADQSEVSTFLGSIAFARATGFADSEVENGLDSPQFRIALHDPAEDIDHVLLVGGQPEEDGGDYYVRDLMRAPVFVVNDEIVTKLRRPLFDWRDKTVASFDREAVTAIELKRGEDRLVIERTGDDWVFADGRVADRSAVAGMLNAIEFERASAIVDSPGSLGSFGLASPPLEVTFRSGSADVLRFAFGSNVGEDDIYWKSPDDPAVKTVSKDVFDRFDVTMEDLIDPGI